MNLYHWKAMSHQQHKPLWEIIAREGDLCSIRGQSSGSVWNNVNINDLEKVNGKEEDKEQAEESQEAEKIKPKKEAVPAAKEIGTGDRKETREDEGTATSRPCPCDESDDCDGNEEERQLELFPT